MAFFPSLNLNVPNAFASLCREVSFLQFLHVLQDPFCLWKALNETHHSNLVHTMDYSRGLTLWGEVIFSDRFLIGLKVGIASLKRQVWGALHCQCQKLVGSSDSITVYLRFGCFLLF